MIFSGFTGWLIATKSAWTEYEIFWLLSISDGNCVQNANYLIREEKEKKNTIKLSELAISL